MVGRGKEEERKMKGREGVHFVILVDYWAELLLDVADAVAIKESEAETQ